MYNHRFLLGKKNFIVVFVGIALMVLGFLLMLGGASTDPNVYPEEVIYGFQRTVLAPALILLGLVVQVYAIMLKPDESEITPPSPPETEKKQRKAIRKAGKR